jgi:hypothetical protein
MSNTVDAYKKQELLTLCEHLLYSPRFFNGVCVAHVFFCLHSVSCVPNVVRVSGMCIIDCPTKTLTTCDTQDTEWRQKNMSNTDPIKKPGWIQEVLAQGKQFLLLISIHCVTHVIKSSKTLVSDRGKETNLCKRKTSIVIWDMDHYHVNEIPRNVYLRYGPLLCQWDTKECIFEIWTIIMSMRYQGMYIWDMDHYHVIEIPRNVYLRYRPLSCQWDTKECIFEIWTIIMSLRYQGMYIWDIDHYYVNISNIHSLVSHWHNNGPYLKYTFLDISLT